MLPSLIQTLKQISQSENEIMPFAWVLAFLPILCSQFKYLHILELLPKYIPSAFIGLDGQDMPDDIFLLSLYLPTHIPSVFVKFKTGTSTVLK